MPDQTISQLEAERYESVLITCNNCRHRVGYPFKLMRMKHPRLRNQLSGMTLDELKPKLWCSSCGHRDLKLAPHRQEDAQGYAKSF